jgi:hypothetical protein
MTYFEKLKDPRWQKKRLEILNRDDFACCFCGNSENTLNVHHLVYEKQRDPWDYEDSLLITLCEDCHKSEHDYRVENEKMLLNILKSNAYSCEDISNLYIVLQRGFLYPHEVMLSIFEEMSINEEFNIFVVDNFLKFKKKRRGKNARK